MEESGYWQRVARRRMSRRRLLAGAVGLGAGLTALSLVGCQEGEEAPTGTPTGTAVATPTPTLVPAQTRGGIYRTYGHDASPPDSFDPHQARSGPVHDIHSAIFSKVLKYDDIYQGTISADLAESVPEPIDQTTYVIKLRPNVRFHDTERARSSFPQVAGRQLTGEDLKYSILRQLNEQSPRVDRYHRKGHWQTVDKIEVGPDGLTVTITTKQPTAPFLHYLADTNAFVIARELVDQTLDEMNQVDRLIGTGPFILDKYVAGEVAQYRRNPDWFARDDLADQGLADRPIIDGYEVRWPPEDDAVAKTAFTAKEVDASQFKDPYNADRVTGEGARVREWTRSEWISSRLLVRDSDRADTPFEPFRLRQAINMAVDRRRLAELMYGEWWVPASPVGQAIQGWALPLSELRDKPGYRFRREEREEEVAEARRLWEAAGGPDVGRVEVIVADTPLDTPDVWPEFQGMLREALGFEPAAVAGLPNLMGLASQDPPVPCRLSLGCVFTLANEPGWADLDDWLYPYFHTDGAENSFNLSDPALDQMLDDQRAEFDLQRRRDLGYQIQRYLLDKVLARLDWVTPISRATVWRYVKNLRPQPWFGAAFHLANLWLDSSHPMFEGRPV